jgi:hypothetical protein
MTMQMTIRTAADRAVEAAARARAIASAECRRRILAVASESTQMNLASAAAAGLLDEADLAAYRAGLGWVAAMRATWAPLAEAGADPADDAAWPACPPEAAALAARF